MKTEKEEHWRLRLVELLAHLKLSQTVFSEQTGIDASYVSRLLYEPGKKGRKNLGIDTMSTIRGRYNLPAGWFDMDLGVALPSAPLVAEPRPQKPPRVAEPQRGWGSTAWPFLHVDPTQYFTLTVAEREHIENDILLRIRGREPPLNQFPPAPNSQTA